MSAVVPIRVDLWNNRYPNLKFVNLKKLQLFLFNFTFAKKYYALYKTNLTHLNNNNDTISQLLI